MMNVLKLIAIGALSAAVLSCSEPDSGEGADPGGLFDLGFATRFTGSAELPGISYGTDPNWGLYVYTEKGLPMVENARMEQTEGDAGWSSDEYKPSAFADGRPENLSTRGGIILSAYYPYRNVMYENNFDPASEDISPKLTTNSLGHPAIHYGIPIYRIARHPRNGQVFDYGGGNKSDNTREVVFFSCYKTINPAEIKDQTLNVELTPTTCRIALVFSLAPRFDDDGQLSAIQPDSSDYEIISVRRYRSNRVDDGFTYNRSSFNYDLLTGKIVDMKFRTDGQFFHFPAAGEPGYQGPVNPYKYDTPDNEDKIAAVEFLCFPTIYDDLKNIQFEVVYRYRLIKATSPEVDEDVWVESTARFSASSTYLVNGWSSGWVYRYHVFISRHEVDYEVEIVPWEFDVEDDQYIGDIQV